jgi:hypothetical protein
MHLFRPIAISLIIAFPARAERMPNPIEFVAGLVALHEQCAQRYPEMKDDLATLAGRSRADDAEMIRLLKASAEFPAALQKARIEVLKMSVEKVDSECKAIHADVTRKNVPGRF